MTDKETGRAGINGGPAEGPTTTAPELASAPAESKTGVPPVHSAPALSNSLTVLAGRIRDEHLAVAESLKDSVRHAIAAGEALAEAKTQVPYGGWLPWLRDHCSMSERTAQLYMRTAKNRTAIEEQIRNGVADLSLNEAAGLLMLTSDMNKLIHFVREIENLDGEELIQRAIADGFTVIQDDSYDPFAGRSEAEILEWHLFTAFLSYDADAVNRRGMQPRNAAMHVEYLLQKSFQNVDQWLGPEGRPFCGGRSQSDEFMTEWAAFRDAHRTDTLADAVERVRRLQQKYDEARAAGRLPQSDRLRRRRRRRAA